MTKTSFHKSNKSSAIILFSFVVIAALIFYLTVLRPQQKYYNANHVNIHGVYLLKPIEINNFEFTDSHNNKFTKENLKGHWTMLYFGFTHCDVVCPVTMDTLNKMYLLLQNTTLKNNLPEIVLVSIDPERDTTKRLNDFVTSFNSNFIGVRSSIESTIALEKQLHIEAQTNQQGSNNFNLKHSADILLINPDAKIQAYFQYPQQPQQLAMEYQSILSKLSNIDHE